MSDIRSDSRINYLAGKALVGALTRDEQCELARHAQTVAFALDLAAGAEGEDLNGYDGEMPRWRVVIGVPESA